jgi:VWFA-related protein
MKCLPSVTLSWLILAQFGQGQSPTAPISQTPSLRANSTLVLVPALIRNKHGNLAFSLTSNDFVITDDGIPQKLTLEQDTGGEPLALVVVIEIGGAGARELDKLGALPSMIESVVGEVPHKVAIVVFDSQSTLLQKFTSDLDAVKASVFDLIPPCSRQNHINNCAAPGQLQNVRAGDNGAAILDSLGFSVDLLRKQPSGYRRAILLISETLDRGSHLKLEDAIRTITDTNTTIYVRDQHHPHHQQTTKDVDGKQPPRRSCKLDETWMHRSLRSRHKSTCPQESDCSRRKLPAQSFEQANTAQTRRSAGAPKRET